MKKGIGIILLGIGIVVILYSIISINNKFKHCIESKNKLNLALSKNKINIENLLVTIEKNNSLIEQKNTILKNKINLLKVWMSKPDTVKYRYITKIVSKDVNYSNASCEEGLKLNESISSMNYDEM